MVLAIV